MQAIAPRLSVIDGAAMATAQVESTEESSAEQSTAERERQVRHA